VLRLPSFTESLEVARGWGRNSEAPHLWNGLAANWNFLQGGGSTLYDIAGSNHGTLTNMDPATDWVMTEKGWALDFDGSNDGVLIDEIAGNISQGTVVALTSVKATVGGNIKGLLGQAGASLQNEWNLNPSLGRHDMLFDDGNFARIDWGGASDIDGWRLWSWSWEGSVVTFGRDNEFQINDAGGTGVIDWATVDVIGDAGTNEYEGQIALLLVYNRALQPSEIQQLYEDPHALNRPRSYSIPVSGTVAPSTAIMNQIQFTGLGSDLFNGTMIP
jgi:hypothetical protein